MARFSGMTPTQATSFIVEERQKSQEREITIEQYEYYASIKAWDMPQGTYERAMWEIFKESVEYKEYVEGERK